MATLPLDRNVCAFLISLMHATFFTRFIFRGLITLIRRRQIMKLLSLQILRALNVRIIVFGNVVPCSLSDRHHCPSRMWWHVVCQVGTSVPLDWGGLWFVRYLPMFQWNVVPSSLSDVYLCSNGHCCSRRQSRSPTCCVLSVRF